MSARGKKKVKKSKKGRKFGKGKALLIAIAVILIAGIVFYVSGTGAASDVSEDVSVTIEQGSLASEVLDTLDEAGLVKNKFCAKIYMKLHSGDSPQANSYAFNRSMRLSEIMNAMADGDPAYVIRNSITVVEGSTIPQVAAAVSDGMDVSQKKVLAKWSDREYLEDLIDEYWFLDDVILDKDIKYPLEGYLYPSTYFVTEDEQDIEKITAMMLDLMGDNLETIRDEIEELDYSIHEFLSFASVVEGETQIPEERAKVAGVYWNRLNQGMKLQSDITTLYALGVKHVDVSTEETAVDSPYNTYVYEGLPVGPVCAVQIDTMNAVIHYKKHDYLFYFSLEDESIIYSKTYKEHLKAIRENDWY